MLAVMNRCASEGTPRPESSAVRAHSKAAFWAFDDAWEKLFPQRRGGSLDQGTLPGLLSRSVKCEYCGNQRSEVAHEAGLSEGKLDETDQL